MENGNKNCISFKYDDCQTYASGVGVWLTVTKTAICGLKAKVHSCPIKKIFNSSLKAALYMTNGKNVIFVPSYYEGRKSSIHTTKELQP